ncbi:MAG: carboxypeptidase-like regulatory domain-containing protein, partial [Granulicella sp.]
MSGVAQETQQTLPAAPSALAPAASNAAQGGTLRGVVKSGTIPLPGVSVTATNAATGKKFATTTDTEGFFAMKIPANGRFTVVAELAAFASETKQIQINASGQNSGKPEQVADFALQLASRVTEERQAAQRARRAVNVASSQGRGMQALSVTGDDTGLADASASQDNSGVQMPTLSGLGTADGAYATDSVTVSGQLGQTNGLANFNQDEIQQRMQDAQLQAQRQGGDTNSAIA